MARASKYQQEVRERAVRMVFDHQDRYASQWGAMRSSVWTLLWLALGCGAPAVPERPPDVLLVVVDTLRWDAVGSYGASRETTPRLDAFARSAVRFERAYATAPWTQPSVASILTGELPSRHGLTRMGSLSDSVVTLAERMAEADYARVGIVSHVLLARKQGFDQGFDRFMVSASMPAHWAMSTEAVTNRAIAVLRAIAASPDDARRPVFLFVHYFDPHYVYHAHPQYGWSADQDPGRLQGSESIETLRALSADLTESERDFVRALYHEEVRHTDEGLGRLLSAVDELGLGDSMLIMVTADHGEELLERGWLGHTRSLHEEVVRVPLIIRSPDGQAGRVVRSPVSLTAIAPTVLDYAGLMSADAEGRAASLRPIVGGSGEGAAEAPAVVIEVDFVAEDERHAAKNTHQKALVRGSLKLIRNDVTGAVALYDLERDPGETTDISGEDRLRTARLVAELDQLLAEARDGAHTATPLATDDALRNELRALGYVERDAP